MITVNLEPNEVELVLKALNEAGGTHIFDKYGEQFDNLFDKIDDQTKPQMPEDY